MVARTVTSQMGLGTENGGDMSKALRLKGYYRVSRVGDREGDSFQAPKRYEQMIRDYAKVQPDVKLQGVVGELDVSGAKLDRSVLQREVIQPILDGKCDGIIVPNLARLSRLAPKDRIALVETIEGAGGVIRSTQEDFDPSTPTGPFQRELFFSLARLQWEQYAE